MLNSAQSGSSWQITEPAASARLRILVRSLQYVIHLISNETGDANQGNLAVRGHLDE